MNPPDEVRDKFVRYGQFLELVKDLAPIPMAVVPPCSPEALHSALDAARYSLIVPFW
ncbi:MAG: hypothetical protein WCD07_04065 [Burkholderiales bacterium]